MPPTVFIIVMAVFKRFNIQETTFQVNTKMLLYPNSKMFHNNDFM